MSRPNLFFIAGLAVYTLAMRLMPYTLSHFGVAIDPANTFYPWNFSPMAAFCLFGAAYYANKYWAYLVPLFVFFLGDLGIWAISGREDWVFTKGMAVVYASFLLIVCLGTFLREKRTLATVLAVGLVGETFFFLTTNFATWYFFNPETAVTPFIYTKDAAGLLKCYTMALPFFGRSLASTMFFSTVIFSPFLYQQRKAAIATKQSPTVAT